MIKIAIAQMEVEAGHPDKNTQKMLEFIQQAKKEKADMIVFPEMSIPGYLLGDSWEQSAYLKDCAHFGEQIAAASEDIYILFGNVAMEWDKRNNDGRVRKYNAFFIAHQEKFLVNPATGQPFVIKTLLPNYREFDDTRYFFSLQKLAAERKVPIENLLTPIEITLQNKKISLGCLLCEDGWSDDYAIAPMKILKEKGADLFINISASPYTFGKNNKRNRVFAAQAKEYNCPLIYVNHIGLQNNGKTLYTFDGSSTVYDRFGEIAAFCPPYQEELQVWNWQDVSAVSAVKMKEHDTIENIFQALTYGIRKFLHNIHMKKVVIGVSGGIDSAVAAALYTHILGPENVLLINMPSVYNSATTKDLASRLAQNLGCQYGIFPIQEVVDYTIRQFESTPISYPGRKVNTNLQISSFTAENIQARDRSARVLAGAAASFGGGFTCNANKAETTVGYSTLYGDQSGFLAALADLWKYQVYALAEYLNTTVYQREVIPQATIDIVPSAELSPNQCVDEGKGDPIRYPYHDYLFRSFVERWDKATPEDILLWYKDGCLEEKIGCTKGLVSAYFNNAQEFIEDLERWWNLFSGMAVAKRIQAPPILAVSRRAYGFDHREAQNGPYYTSEYKRLKALLLDL